MSSTDPNFCHSLYVSSSPPSSASSTMSHNRQPPYFNHTSEACSPADDSRGKYYEELWQACAGPLVSLPKLNQLVMYLPQGHLEEISASTNQGADCTELPKHDLSPHILCRVVDVRLCAEPETDEVKAQLSLLPQTEGSDWQETVEEELPSPSSKPTVHMFCKTLTASDTSTHGGFSVPRKHAICLPTLDTTQSPPTQELEATDLHGIKWRFRHIYRGQPKRHLLTTGWSAFVTQKKLVAGDAVIFLRGEDGELRVGIRRGMRQPNTPPPSVLPSQSLQMGVIATATHAILARTMFCVYYKPRVSPAEFIIPLERFKSSLAANLAVGMRFKMKFENEDLSERCYNGTITGVEDFDSSRWPSSKWRSLKVGWDEPTIYERHDRVSPWEIELCVNPAAPPNPAPGPRSKRIRTNNPSSSAVAEHSLVSTGRSKTILASILSANEPTVLQGQELQALGVKDAYHGGHHYHPPPGPLSQSQHLHSHASQLPSLQQPWGGYKQGNGQPCWGMPGQDGRGSYPFSSSVPPQHGFLYDAFFSQHSRAGTPLAFSNQHSTAGPSGIDSANWQARSLDHPSGSLPMSDSTPSWQMNSRPPLHGSIFSSLSTSNQGLLLETSMSSQQPMHVQASPPNQSSYLCIWQKKGPQEGETESAVAPMAVVGTGEAHTGCKLFGFSLTDPPPSKPKQSAEKLQAAGLNDSQLNDPEREVEQLMSKEASTLVDMSTTSSDQQEAQKHATNNDVSREAQCRGQFAGRSCTKVIKKGSIVGRGVDLSKLGGYDQLFEELERMFHLEGQLRDKERGWQVAYADNENDMLEVGDDPWGEFCTMARKIHILSREEVAQGNKRTPKF